MVKDALYADMRQGTTEENNETPRFVYTPFQQSDELNEMTVYVRDGRPGRRGHAASSCGRRSAARTRRCRSSRCSRWTQTVDEALFNERMLALLSASFGLLATRAGRHRALRRDVLHRVAPHA